MRIPAMVGRSRSAHAGSPSSGRRAATQAGCGAARARRVVQRPRGEDRRCGEVQDRVAARVREVEEPGRRVGVKRRPDPGRDQRRRGVDVERCGPGGRSAANSPGAPPGTPRARASRSCPRRGRPRLSPRPLSKSGLTIRPGTLRPGPREIRGWPPTAPGPGPLHTQQLPPRSWILPLGLQLPSRSPPPPL